MIVQLTDKAWAVKVKQDIPLPPGQWTALGFSDEITGERIRLGEDHYKALLITKECTEGRWFIIYKEGE